MLPDTSCICIFYIISNPTVVAMNRRSKNPVAVQFTRLHVSADHQCLLYWNPEDIGPNANEGMGLLAKQKQAGKEGGSVLPCLLYRLSAEGMAQIRVGFCT